MGFYYPRCTWIDFFGQIKNKSSPKFPTIQYLEADMIITVMCVSVILSLE